MCSIPGSRMSSVKLLRPARSAGSSLRSTLFPMYRRTVSVMPRPPRLSRNPLPSSSLLYFLLQLYEILARVHGLLALDEKLGDGALFLGLDLVEGFHDLDQADGVSSRDLVALLDVGVALRIGAAVEGARHLRFNDLVGQLTSSFRSSDPLLCPT